MTAIIGYWLSGAIAVGILLIGARFLLAPYAAAQHMVFQYILTHTGTPTFR
jgi:hypothetical protein